MADGDDLDMLLALASSDELQTNTVFDEGTQTAAQQAAQQRVPSGVAPGCAAGDDMDMLAALADDAFIVPGSPCAADLQFDRADDTVCSQQHSRQADGACRSDDQQHRSAPARPSLSKTLSAGRSATAVPPSQRPDAQPRDTGAMRQE